MAKPDKDEDDDKNQKQDEKTTAKEQGQSEGEVRKTWHQAREDAQNSDDKYDKWLTQGWKRDKDDDDDDEE